MPINGIGISSRCIRGQGIGITTIIEVTSTGISSSNWNISIRNWLPV
jgi:hypothetical protein